MRTQARAAIAVAELVPQRVGRPRPHAAQPARQASATYAVGDKPLTAAAVRSIIKRVVRAAVDQGLVRLFGAELELSTHSLRVGLTLILFASGAVDGPAA